MALNDYSQNLYLPKALRVWLNTPNKVNVYRAFDYLRIFDGYDLLAVMNNNFANDLASGYTNSNISNLMSGVAPRLLEILVSKIINKVDYTGYQECEKLQNVLSKEYLSIKLKKSYNNAIRTGRDLLVLYPDKETKKVKIRNIELFRHKLIFDDEELKEVLILSEKLDAKANENYMIFEHRYYNKLNKPCQEFTVEYYKWNYDGDLTKTEKTKLSKEDIERLIRTANPVIQERLREFNFYKEIELPLKDLGCYYIDNTKYNSKFPYSRIPESRFVNIQDKIVEIENSITYKEIDKEIGRGRALIPNSFNFNVGVVDGNAQNLKSKGVFTNPLDSTYFVQYNSNSMDKAVAPQGIQFDIRAEQWRTTINGEIGDLCAAFGISILDYDPRLLQAGQRTDDEINAMTDITASTVQDLRTMNEYQINKMLDTIASFVGEEKPIKIQWSLSTIINPTKNQQLIGMQLQNGTISRLEAVKRSNPDYSTKEVEEELNRIKEERGLAEANAVF